jgi:hypothetical protein
MYNIGRASVFVMPLFQDGILFLSPPTNVIRAVLNTERPFYVFTSGRVTITAQNPSRKKAFRWDRF